MKKKRNSRRKIALRYARSGWPVVPFHTVKHGACSCQEGSACTRPGKHPKTIHGVKDATTDRATIINWWTEDRFANIGIAPGRKANIIILDIDPRNGGDKTLTKLGSQIGTLPPTPTAITGGGGCHLVFEHPSFAVKKDTAGKLLGPGVDVLSEGCIAVAPPSRHKSGVRYTWEDGRSFGDVKPAKLPKAWRKRLRGISGNSDARDSIPLPAGAVAEGSRNICLASLAGTLQRSGASAEAITAALKAENNAKCVPPLDGSEIKKIVASITKYPAPLADGKDPAESMMQLTLDRHFNAGKHLMLGTDGRFWHFDARLWCPVSDQWVAGKVLEMIEANPTKGQRTAALVTQTVALLRAKLAVQNDPLRFIANPPPVINCMNGELWIDSDGQVDLRPHAPGSHLRQCIDVAYDPDAQCPEYDKTVLEIFGGADDPKAMVRHWNEMAGYMIQGCRNIPLVLVLFGYGENGKTKLLETVIRLLGSQLVHAHRVDDLEKNRFMMGSLFGKYLLVDDDVRAGARLPDGILKTISEAKEVTGENKFGPAFNFTVRTVPALICNNVPSLADLSHGMQRRLMVIPFDRTFSDQDRDRFLFDRIWANELSGVLNRLLAGYRRVLKRNAQFDPPSAVKAATERLFQQANPLPAFIAECCVKKASAKCLMQDFYRAYVNWTQAMGYTLTQTQQAVRRNLEHLNFGSTKRNIGQVILGLELAPKGAADEVG